MKIRSGFVSNSSSSSFILFKDYLTKDQIEQIKNYETYALSDEYKEKVDNYNGKDKPEHYSPEYSEEDFDYYPEGWRVEETFNVLDVSTTMNNYDMLFFCKMIGVDVEKCGLIIEDEHYFTLGFNDAQTDLKHYLNDKNFCGNYDKYKYESKYYEENLYPMMKEEFDSGWISHLVEPGGKTELVKDKDGNVTSKEINW